MINQGAVENTALVSVINTFGMILLTALYVFFTVKIQKQWLRENPRGFVFNHIGTAEMNKMHHASCFQLHMLRDSGKRTNYQKIVQQIIANWKMRQAE